MNHNINNQTFSETEQWFTLWITAMWQDSCTLHLSVLRSLSLFYDAESCQLPLLPPVRCINLGTKPGEQEPPCRVFTSHQESCEAIYWGDAFAATSCSLCLCELLQMRTKRFCVSHRKEYCADLLGWKLRERSGKRCVRNLSDEWCLL